MSKRQGLPPSGSFKGALQTLSRWFERQKRVLPWRETPTSYRVWISEIMLQQTQVATVVPFFERFMARFPDVDTLSRAPEADVMALWAGLGYYSRARNLHAAAKQVVQAGRFPGTREGWLELPGIGPYTAGAILSISSDQAVPILDGNVERVLSRVRRVARGGGDARYKARLWRLAKIFVERGVQVGVRPSVLNQALMELGATVCIPRGEPACPLCPLSSICRARAAGDPQAYPPAKRPKEWTHVREELHCWLRPTEDVKAKGSKAKNSWRVLLRQRAPGEWRAGLWDLMGEAPEKGKLIGTVETRHVVTRHKILRVTTIWEVTPSSNGIGLSPLRATEESAVSERWGSLEHPDVPLGAAAAKTLLKIIPLAAAYQSGLEVV